MIRSGPLVWSTDFLVPCILAVTLVQYFYLCAFAFLLLESLIIIHKLVDSVIIPLLENPLFIVSVGCLVPLLYTAVTIPFLFSYLIPSSPKM